MEKIKRRFCSIECMEDPAENNAIQNRPNLLVSALERHGIPYELVVNRCERENPSDPNSCDQYPNGVGTEQVFVCEFLTTDLHFENACAIASKILPPNTHLGSKSR